MSIFKFNCQKIKILIFVIRFNYIPITKVHIKDAGELSQRIWGRVYRLKYDPSMFETDFQPANNLHHKRPNFGEKKRALGNWQANFINYYYSAA